MAILQALVGELQAAMTSAVPGDTIVLRSGDVHTGKFTWPVKGGASYVEIRSSGTVGSFTLDDANLPGIGQRITPVFEPYLAKIRPPTNDRTALITPASASYLRLSRLEVLSHPDGLEDCRLIELGANDSTQNRIAQIPHHFELDRLYVHAASTKRA